MQQCGYWMGRPQGVLVEEGGRTEPWVGEEISRPRLGSPHRDSSPKAGASLHHEGGTEATDVRFLPSRQGDTRGVPLGPLRAPSVPPLWGRQSG